MRSHKRTNTGGHCPKHYPKAKKMKTDDADPDDTLPDLPVTTPIEIRDNTWDTIMPSKQSETLLQSVVTVTETTTPMASKMADTTDANESEHKQNAATQSVVTEREFDTTSTVIEIEPMIDPMLEVETEVSELDPNRDTGTQPRSVVTEASNTNKTGETRKVQTNTQQQIS